MTKVIPNYSPVPLRAIGDKRLAERHLRTLMVIAAHDRLGANGIGCWASHERLAELIGCNYNRLSMNLRELGEWGYIERKCHPLNRKMRVYSVVYTPEDKDTIKNVRGDKSQSQDTEDEGVPVGSPSGEQPRGISSPRHPGFANENKGVGCGNIFRETGNTFCRNRGINSPEGASRNSDAGNTYKKVNFEDNLGAQLARLERAIKGGAEINPAEWQAWLYDLTELDIDDGIAGWAGRLIDDLAALEGYEGEGARRR